MVEEKFEKMSTEEIINYITVTFHEPIKKFFEEMTPKIDKIDKEYSWKYSKIDLLKELYTQFHRELMKHLTKEDLEVFPSVLKYEKVLEDGLEIQKNKEVEKIINQIKMQNDHVEFQSYFYSIIDLLNSTDMNWKWIEDFEYVKDKFITMWEETKVHSMLENTYIYPKGVLLQKKLQEMFS